MEWTRDLFEEDRSLKTTGKDGKRSQLLAEIVQAMDPDFLGIAAEGPNTLVNGSKTAGIQLKKWIQHFLPRSPLKGIHGFSSSGQQELCALYNPNKFNVLFTPDTKPGQRFDEPFLTDTTNRLIKEQYEKEQYEHYRPPLELSILGLDDQLFGRVIIASYKVKGGI